MPCEPETQKRQQTELAPACCVDFVSVYSSGLLLC